MLQVPDPLKKCGRFLEVQSHKGNLGLFTTDILHQGLATLALMVLEEIMIGGSQ